MPGAAAAIIDAWAFPPKACDSGRGMLHGHRYEYLLDDEDAKLPLSEDPTSSHDSEAGTWRPTAQPQAIPGAAKGVPCMADELELQAEEIEEQDPWAAEDDGGINGSVSSLDSCALSGPTPPAPLQPAWAVAGDSVRMAVSGGSIVRKPAPSPFTSSDDGGWGDNIPVCTTPVIGVRPRAVQQQRQAGDPSRQATPSVQAALLAPGRQWLRPLVQQPASQWRGCRKGPRCDRENRHRGICNTRAVPPSSFVQQALLCGDGSADGMADEALVPGRPVAQHSGLYRADAAYLQSPLRGPEDSIHRLSPPRLAGVASPPPPPPVRQSQRRLKMAAAAHEEHDSASHGSDDDAFARRSLSSRPSSSEVLSGSSAGDFSDDDDDEEESQSRPYPPPLAPQHDARTHRLPVGAAKRVASSAAEGLLDLVPPPKLPPSASASSMSPKQQQQQPQQPLSVCVHAARAGGRGPRDAPKAGRRPASGRAAAAMMRPRKRAAGGRGTGPPAATLPGQHCSSCHTQVTPVWRAGPLGPKTLCNACGVRYMKTVKPRR